MVGYDSFVEALKIDKNSLDEELIKQPEIYHSISDEYALAISNRDAKKEQLETTDAELDAHYRTVPDKVTETRIKNLVQVDPRHTQAFEAYNEAKLKAARLDALKEAFGQRSSMLKELAQLTISGFTSSNFVRESPSAVQYNNTRAELAKARLSK